MSEHLQTTQRKAVLIERSWRLVCFFIVMIFVLRGGALLAILPPFEGWDEYQHLARIAFVVENGRSPKIDESKVPRSLYPAIASLPHGRLDVEQTHGIGALPYLANERADPPTRSYWDGPRPKPDANAPDIPLYQAQHGPLYYWLMTPVYKILWDPARPLTCIYALRLVNLAFGTGAIAGVLWALSRLISTVRPRIWIALLLAVQPLFLLNVARIANDAAAVCLGIAATGLLLVHGRRGGVIVGVAAGALAGLAVLSKSVALVLLPFAIAVPLVGLMKRETTAPRAIKLIACFFAVFLLVTGDYFYSNWKAYGVAVPMQESIRNQQNNRGLADMVAAMGQIDWWRQLRSRICRDSLWVGGWSFLTLPSALRGIHEGLIGVAMAGFVLGPILRMRGKTRNHFSTSADSPRALAMDSPVMDFASVGLMALMVVGALAGLAYHTLQSKLAYGTITTNVWYACLAFPWMIALLVFGVNGLRSRADAIWVGAMMLLCLAAECIGLFKVMPEGYTGLAWSAKALERLASVHPEMLFPDLAIAFELAAIATAVAIYVMSIRGMQISQQNRPLPSDPPRDPAR